MRAESFTTGTARPDTSGANVRNVTAESAYVHTDDRCAWFGNGVGFGIR